MHAACLPAPAKPALFSILYTLRMLSCEAFARTRSRRDITSTGRFFTAQSCGGRTVGSMVHSGLKLFSGKSKQYPLYRVKLTRRLHSNAVYSDAHMKVILLKDVGGVGQHGT